MLSVSIFHYPSILFQINSSYSFGDTVTAILHLKSFVSCHNFSAFAFANIVDLQPAEFYSHSKE